jgi:hypothetical protein
MLSWCESTHGIAWHLRELGPSGYHPGGGADTPSLCGFKMSWDLEDVATTEDEIRRLHKQRGICTHCTTEALKRKREMLEDKP